jgi:hypothetical protein
MFKGFTTAQTNKILQENDYNLQMKRESQEIERKQARDWARQQAMLLNILESVS